MKNFGEKLRAMVFNSSIPLIASVPIDFVKTRKGMQKELVISKESGNAVGIYSKALGDGMFLTKVEHIRSDGVIIFNRYDMSGAILSRHELTLHEIQMVCPINQRYRYPLLTKTTRTDIKAAVV
jgi:hypothetical protein